ncbi:MAG: DUF4299 domain-containing protein [Bacilli bacterium]|nr:DUF4299 domain-containing protein [Bacilli bacterium]
MAVNVTIEDKRIISKKYKVEDFLFESMGYGVADDVFRLVEGKTGDVTIVYSKKNLERGIELSTKKKKVNLRMSLPTGEDEIIFFYDYVKKICSLFHTTVFEREGELSSLTQIPSYIEYDRNASIGALQMMEENLENGTYASLSLYAVYNPIAIDKKDLYLISKDLQKLGTFLEEKQSIDAYYGSATIYQKPDHTMFGIYTLTEDVLSILPLEPTVMIDKTKIETIYISFAFDEKMQGIMKYQDFLSNINKDNLYDCSHFLVQLKKEKMAELLETYQIEM